MVLSQQLIRSSNHSHKIRSYDRCIVCGVRTYVPYVQHEKALLCPYSTANSHNKNRLIVCLDLNIQVVHTATH